MKKGFSRIETLLIILIILVLTTIVILVINPSRQSSFARNEQRKSDVNTILNAVYQYYLDNKEILPSNITGEPREICKTGVQESVCITNNLVFLGELTSNETYLKELPVDPSNKCAVNGTCYKIWKSPDGHITVSAPNAESGITISASR